MGPPGIGEVLEEGGAFGGAVQRIDGENSQWEITVPGDANRDGSAGDDV